MLNRYYTELEKEIKKTINLCDNNSPIEKQFLLKIIDFVLRKSISGDFYSFRQNYKLTSILEVVNKYGETYDFEDESEESYDRYFIRIFYSGYNENEFKRYIDIKPQFKVFYIDKRLNVEKYFILDFGVFLYKKGWEKDILRKFCIECDGYEFHSKKDHIIKDNKRSRKLLEKENDFTTIRFLGREINDMSDEVISDLLDVLFQEKKDDPL
jgi:hypothetical protein